MKNTRCLVKYSLYTRGVQKHNMIMETTQKSRSIEIANTIRQQLLTLGKIKVWSWGANTWKAINNGLILKVQGFKFKGEVAIILMPNDTYTIRLINRRQVVKEFTNIYFDMMVDLIDKQVEYTGENYESYVNNAIYNI